ncbi:MAG: ABC transporter ATP-binding protein [Candidatus Rokubacteria bacterium 13_1_40CM_68_15]|nr:MAG: ABC transporter ATP-binding protein [Candidatus Rokubacteria bacterium 13_1_40CM_68_15]
MLEIADLHTYYGDSHILHGVSLRVAAGEAVALLGRNGAGKTTLIRSVVGFTPPRAGRISFDGLPIQGRTAYAIARLGIGLVPQGRRIFAPLTVTENLMLGARKPAPGHGARVRSHAAPRAGHPRLEPGSRSSLQFTRERAFALFPRLRERALQGGGTLSGGEQQMLAVARALMTNPQLLLLDEPSEGLAPLIIREIGRVLIGLKQQGLSILLVEQNVPLALRVADRVYVMNKGQIVYEGSSVALAADEAVKRRFLGVS